MTEEKVGSGGALVVLRQLTPAIFESPERVDDLLAGLEREVRAVAVDVTTEPGRRACASLAYKVARSKTALDEMGRDLVADTKKKIALIDAERRKIRDRCDALRAEIRRPLDLFEDRERLRVEEHERCVAALTRAADIVGSSHEIRARIVVLDKYFTGRDWQEFGQRADEAYWTSRKSLERRAGEAEREERERVEAAERERRIAEEARARAEREAAQKARERAERGATEKIAAERRRAEEAEAAKRAAEEHVELRRVEGHRVALAALSACSDAFANSPSSVLSSQLKHLEFSYANRDWQEFACSADHAYRVARGQLSSKIAAAKDRERRAAGERETKIRDEAAAGERKRVEEERRREAEERALREEDQKHRAEVEARAADAILDVACEFEHVCRTMAATIVSAIVRGEVPGVRIEY